MAQRDFCISMQNSTKGRMLQSLFLCRAAASLLVLKGFFVVFFGRWGEDLLKSKEDCKL